MLTNYYTLRALIEEWGPRLAGAVVVEGYSQHKGSLILVFETSEGAQWSLNASVQAPLRHLFMYSGSNRWRKNVVDVFAPLRNQQVAGIELAQRDRMVILRLTSGDSVHFAIYGPRANVFFRHGPNKTLSSFRGSNAAIPELRIAPPPPTPEEIEAHLSKGKHLKTLVPLFPKALIEELWSRTGPIEDPQILSASILQMLDELDSPKSLVYWGEGRIPFFSTIFLSSLGLEPEEFESVDQAVCVCARRKMAVTRFSGLYDPLLKSIKVRAVGARKSLGKVVLELDKPSRADLHEKMGHLLMAQPRLYTPGSLHVTVPDIISEGPDVLIVMDPNRSAIENAGRYYEKAKAARAAREVSLERLQSLQKTAADLEKLLDEALHLDTVENVTKFQTKHETWLRALRASPDDPDIVPYRRYVLDDGYEVWVGRNAKQNDQLTLRDSRKYDLWLHARGVAGSHTILRLRGREDKPSKKIIEQAAAIAAWHSKARPSALVPVIVVERKYVRKPRKALPGAVLVEREKVVLVAPKLPE